MKMRHYYCGLLVAAALNAIQLSGAQGFHIRIDTNIRCVDCGPESPTGCLTQDCSIPVGQLVQINCTVAIGCDNLSHTPSILHVTSEEYPSPVTDHNMPGFVSLHTTGCNVSLTFTATPAANNIVLQCGISTNEVMEYSIARVIAVREPPPPASPSPSATVGVPLQPTSSPSSPPPTMTSSTTENTSPPPPTTSSPATTSGTDSSVSPGDCVCPIRTSIPSGARTNSLSIWLTFTLTLFSLVHSVARLCL